MANGGMLSSGTAHRYLVGRTLTLNAASTFSGGNQLFWNSATLNNNALLDIKMDADLGHYSGTISTFNNNSTITKSTGSGLTLIGANFNNFGTVTIDTGTVFFTQMFTQDSTGTLDVHILGESDLDQIGVSKPAALDGTVNVIRNGYTPPSSTAFDIMVCTPCGGAFATVNGNGVTFTQAVAADKVTLTAD